MSDAPEENPRDRLQGIAGGTPSPASVGISGPRGRGPSKAKPGPTLADEIGGKAERKLRARRRGDSGLWFGLGMMGLIGWSVAIPTVLGAALGLWLDQKFPGGRSWTLALLVAGLVLGCVNAWHWVAKEEKAMRDEQEDDHE